MDLKLRTSILSWLIFSGWGTVRSTGNVNGIPAGGLPEGSFSLNLCNFFRWMLSLNIRHNLFPKFIWILPIYSIKCIFGKDFSSKQKLFCYLTTRDAKLQFGFYGLSTILTCFSSETILAYHIFVKFFFFCTRVGLFV